MKNHEVRRQELQAELAKRLKDPVATLYGFLCQNGRQLDSPGNEQASKLFHRLVEEAGLTDLMRHGQEEWGASFLPRFKEAVRDLILINRDEIRASRRALAISSPRKLIARPVFEAWQRERDAQLS